MNERLGRAAARLDALETQERVLLSMAAALVLVAAWYLLLIEPLQIERRRLEAQAAAAGRRAEDAAAETARVLEAARRDPNAALREQLAAAAADIERFEGEIRDRAGQLIAPEQMPLILRSVLEHTRGLEFVGLEGLGSQPLLEDDGDAEAAGANAYRHGFRISFHGSYLDTLAYLRSLEALPWRFFWDAVEIEVTRHPDATAAVVVYTLSLDRRWIGV